MTSFPVIDGLEQGALGDPLAADGLSPSVEPLRVSPADAASIPIAGDIFIVPYPFVRDTYSGFDGEGYVEIATWRPGIRFENIGPEDSGAVADAIGSATFVAVDVFKPGRFPTRVFFTRKFTSPDGQVFGKGKLHIVTLDKFRRLTRGYQHPFGIGEPMPPQWSTRRSRDWFEALLAEHMAAQGIEARSDATAQTGAAEGESPVPQGCATTLEPNGNIER